MWTIERVVDDNTVLLSYSNFINNMFTLARLTKEEYNQAKGILINNKCKQGDLDDAREITAV